MQWSWRAGGALWRCAPVAAASGALSLPPPLLAATVAPAPVCVCVQRWVCMYAMHTHEHAQTQPIQNTWMCARTHACIHAKMHSRKSPTAGSCLSYTQKRRPQLLGHTRKTTHQDLAIHANIHARIHARIRTRSSSTAGAGTSSLPPASCSGACANPRGVQLRIIAVTDSAGGALPASVSGAASVWEVS